VTPVIFRDETVTTSPRISFRSVKRKFCDPRVRKGTLSNSAWSVHALARDCQTHLRSRESCGLVEDFRNVGGEAEDPKVLPE